MKILAQLNLVDPKNLPKPNTSNSLKTGLTITFTIIGALAFLMIVIAGLRYVFARGDTNKIAEAKNMILYSIIGLVLAASAAAIVNVVIGRVQ